MAGTEGEQSPSCRQGTGAETAIAAPNGSYSGINATNGLLPPARINLASDDGFVTQMFDFLLESTSIFHAASGSGGRLFAYGWDDNL